MPERRDIDVTLFGVTGFVGRLTADYLARHAPADARIALAGRSRERVERVRATLPAPASQWPVVVADTDDTRSVAAMAERSTTVATTVGPYALYGMPVVEACAAAGTHYADLTGEVMFIRKAVERFDATAASTGARIVHGCGFDSIPSDLGVLVLHERVRADDAGDLGETTLVVTGIKGGLSGGTIASTKVGLDEVRKDPSLRRMLFDPYVLDLRDDARGRTDAGGGRWRPAYEPRVGRWVAPFVMGAMNVPVVHRSNALQGDAYGRGFRYREVMRMPRGPVGAVAAAALTGGLGVAVGALALRPTRALLDRALPSPGEGPSEKTRSAGYFRIEIHTTTSAGAHYVSRVAATGDPGYAATSVMFGETALALALDGADLPDRAGVLTPATGLGMHLVRRLRRQGMTFEAGPA